jgi:hypothetical protein
MLDMFKPIRFASGILVKRCLLVAATGTLIHSAFGADGRPEYSPLDTGSSIVIGGGPSVAMLGSWEKRIGGLVGYSVWKPEPKIARTVGAHSDAVWTFYGMYHEGQDSRWSPDPTLSAGFTYGYRKSWVDQAGRGAAYQLYWGFVGSDRNSHDLPSVVNSTPGMTFSWLEPAGAKNLSANLMWMHISNAGTTAHNRGENFFLLTLDFRLH